MDPKKLEMIEEILEHLSGHQAKVLKDLLDKSRAPKDMPQPEESMEGEPLKPKGVEVEIEVEKPDFDKKVEGSIEDHTRPEMDKKPGEEMGDMDKEMTDDELEELLKKIC